MESPSTTLEPWRPRPGRLLGDVIVELGLADRGAVERAVVEARGSGRPMGQVLLEELTVPVAFRGERVLLVAMLNPSNVLAVDDIAMITDHRIQPAVISEDDLHALLARLTRLDEGLVQEEAELEHEPADELDLRDDGDDAPTVRLVQSIIAQAVDQHASDIHFDPVDGELQIRLRSDGVMVDAGRVPRAVARKVVSRIKILADLEIAERRLPRGLEELGMGAEDRARLARALGRSHGAVLATGPTGSGKSTSLYAALMTVRSPEKTVMSIEDPVEYRLPGVKQVQVNERSGLTFASGLRTMMRATPT